MKRGDHFGGDSDLVKEDYRGLAELSRETGRPITFGSSEQEGTYLVNGENYIK